MPNLNGQPITDANSLITGDGLLTFATNGNVTPTFTTSKKYNGNMSLYGGVKDDIGPDDYTHIDVSSLLTDGKFHSDFYFRTYMYVPTQTFFENTNIIGFGRASGASDGLMISNGNTEETADRFMIGNMGSTQIVSPTTIPLNSWFRMEFLYTSTENSTFRIWNNPSSTGVPDQELTTPNVSHYLSPENFVIFDYNSGAPYYIEHYLDGVSIGTTGWIGTGTGNFWNNNFDASQGRKKSAGLIIPN